MKIKMLKCNCCGKTFQIENEMIKEGVFQAQWEWGYFSEKDGERHSFCLCEACYDKIVNTFTVPVQVEEYL